MFELLDYYEAVSVADALNYLAQYPDARPVAGGTDVLIKLREGKLKQARLVGITRIPELSEIRLDTNGNILIGATASFKRILKEPLIQTLIPTLAEAVEQVGGPQIRNMGTLGGNIANGITSADSAPTMLALDALIHIAGSEGTRTCPIREFYRSAGKTQCHQQELITHFTIAQKNYEKFGGHYIKYAMRNAMDIATLTLASLIRLDESGAIDEARIAMGVAAPVPIRLFGAEDALRGARLNPSTLARAWEAACAEINPRTSWRASAEFRMQIAKELLCRALTQAYYNAKKR